MTINNKSYKAFVILGIIVSLTGLSFINEINSNSNIWILFIAILCFILIGIFITPKESIKYKYEIDDEVKYSNGNNGIYTGIIIERRFIEGHGNQYLIEDDDRCREWHYEAQIIELLS